MLHLGNAGTKDFVSSKGTDRIVRKTEKSFVVFVNDLRSTMVTTHSSWKRPSRKVR